ncbi:MAG: XRE family transcriptional regulator [Bacillota bacterium]|nr:XRE family transcriptional regulator [Bacillota bacterium]
MTLGDLIKSYRSTNGLTMQEFANLSGLSKAYVSMLEKGRHPQNNKEIIPSIDTFNKVALAMKLSLNEVLEAVNSNQLINLDVEPQLKNIDSIFPITVKKFPLLGEISCGEPILANEDRESYILSGTDIDADFCLKAKGDSMIGARIHDGDIVFIKKADVVNNGEVAAVIIDDEVLLKRFYYFKDENLLTLQSENPKYPPKNYVNEQLDHIRVIGKAIAFQSDVR